MEKTGVPNDGFDGFFFFFFNSSPHRIFEYENFRFPFYYENSITWGVKCEKLKIVHEWNGHIEIFSRPQIIENSRQYLLLRTDILQKTVVGCP